MKFVAERCFRTHSKQQGIFPPVYVTSVLAGEKSGALAEVLDRFITYQKTALAIRKKVIVSLIYPCFLVVLVVGLIIFLVTFVVPNFAELYGSMSAQLPAMTQVLIAVGTTARSYILLLVWGCGRGRHWFPVLVAGRGGAAQDRFGEAAGSRLWRHLDQVSGRAVFAHPEHACCTAAFRWFRRSALRPSPWERLC